MINTNNEKERLQQLNELARKLSAEEQKALLKALKAQLLTRLAEKSDASVIPNKISLEEIVKNYTEPVK